jgi:hypothetical protein
MFPLYVSRAFLSSALCFPKSLWGRFSKIFARAPANPCKKSRRPPGRGRRIDPGSPAFDFYRARERKVLATASPAGGPGLRATDAGATLAASVDHRAVRASYRLGIEQPVTNCVTKSPGRQQSCGHRSDRQSIADGRKRGPAWGLRRRHTSVRPASLRRSGMSAADRDIRKGRVIWKDGAQAYAQC